MLRNNLWTGALGYVEDIFYEQKRKPPEQMLKAIMV